MNHERLELLREALPYIQRFKNNIFVVKLSGKITEDQDQLNSLAEEITLCQHVGIHVAVVHGGGKQLTTIAERLGITSGGSKSQLFKARAKLRTLLAHLVDTPLRKDTENVAPAY